MLANLFLSHATVAQPLGQLAFLSLAILELFLAILPKPQPLPLGYKVFLVPFMPSMTFNVYLSIYKTIYGLNCQDFFTTAYDPAIPNDIFTVPQGNRVVLLKGRSTAKEAGARRPPSGFMPPVPWG
jgi:hypothetical protein